MSQIIRITVLPAAVLLIAFATTSDSWAQFSGIRGFQIPGGAARGVAQRILNQEFGQRQQRYSQPTYNQPRCNQQPVYSQPVYSQPVYSQPVYSQPVYTQPAPAPVNPQPVRKPTPIEIARQYTADAKTLFQKGSYPEAGKKLDEVVKLAPKDSNAYQFRALTHFARSDFKAAAADAYDAMALGNAWTGEVIQSIYGAQSLGTYNNQLDQLKRVVDQNPSMQSHFLLAYHHLVNSQWSEGKTQLEKVLALQPEEQLSQKLLAAVESKLNSGEKDVALKAK